MINNKKKNRVLYYIKLKFLQLSQYILRLANCSIQYRGIITIVSTLQCHNHNQWKEKNTNLFYLNLHLSVQKISYMQIVIKGFNVENLIIVKKYHHHEKRLKGKSCGVGRINLIPKKQTIDNLRYLFILLKCVI